MKTSDSGRSSPKNGRKRGFIVLVVLMMIVVVSFVLTQFIEKAMAEISGEGYYVERDQLRLTAYSALDATLAVLADISRIDNGLRAPQQGWADPLGYAGIDFGPKRKVSVQFIDETGKLPLNSLDDTTLNLLFQDMGFDDDSCQQLTDCFLDWTDEDDRTRLDGAELPEYSQGAIPYAAKNGPLTRFSELRSVNGFKDLFFDENGAPNSYYTTFEQTVSPYTQGNLNINTAPDLALLVSGLFSDTQITSIRKYLNGADDVPGTADDRYFDSLTELQNVVGDLPQGAKIGVSVQILRVRIHVVEGLSEFTLEAVISLNGSSAQNVTRNSTRPSPSNTSSQTKTNVTAQSNQLQYPFVFLEINEEAANNNAADATVAENPTESP